MSEKINDLNPNGIDFTSYTGLKFFNPVKMYFSRIRAQEAIISTLIKKLESNQEILKRDNITLKIEINKLNKIIEDLDIEYNKGKDYLEELKKTINNFSQEEINQFNINLLEKRLFDFKQMIIVKEQSVLALNIILNNNDEIIRNIDKIKNVTIEALKTSVIVANSIYNQKIILRKINLIDKGAQSIINDTNKLLQTTNLNDKSSKIQISELLKDNFENMINTLNAAKIQSEKCFPENSIKILEIKKGV